ncbi:MAG: hypothetical protein J6M64_12725 [Oscillospiraceae bacterium]|nr:hypothetical protein [Oscillospiraceae bacterium]
MVFPAVADQLIECIHSLCSPCSLTRIMSNERKLTDKLA